MEKKPKTINDNDEHVNKNFEETKLICKIWKLYSENYKDNYNWASIIEMARYCNNAKK